MIKRSTIELINSTAKIEEVVEDFVNLKRRGVNMLGLCPFHDEKTPSFTVSPAKNIYKCFGCGKGGDPVRFIMDHETMTYPEALRYLAHKYNIEIEETVYTKEEEALKELNSSYYIINEFAQEYFEDKLFNTDEGKSVGLSYFRDRGFNQSTIKKFQLGYTTRESNDFTQTALKKQYNEEYLKHLGLTSKSGYDFFRSRVMFSIHNLSGKVIAFAGRTLSSDKKVPKYINSPETDIYNKRKVLYALYFAKTAIRKEDECIMVEGYTDVITLHQNGIENVVASSGTSLTVEQIGLVRRYTQNMKIIYDGDTAGVKAALRGLDLVLEQDMNVKLVQLPEGEDPDSYLKKVGIDAFRDYLTVHEEDFLFFKTNLLLGEAGDDPIKKSQVLKDIVRSIAKIPDMIKRSLYVKKCATMMDISEEILVAETNKALKAEIKQKQKQNNYTPKVDEEQFITKKPTPSKDGTKSIKKIVTGDDYQERDLLRILITHGNLPLKTDTEVTVAQYVQSIISDEMEYIDNVLFKKMFSMILQQVEENGEVNIEIFKTSDDEEVRNITIDFLSTPYIYASWEKHGLFFQTQKAPEENQEKDTIQAVLRFLLRKADKKIKEIEKVIVDLSKEEGKEDIVITYMKAYKIALSERTELASQLGTVLLH